MRFTLAGIVHRATPIIAIAMLVAAMDGTWTIGGVGASPSPIPPNVLPTYPPAKRPPKEPPSPPSSSTTSPSTASTAAATGRKIPEKVLTGTINLNTATEQQLMMLPTVGPSKAERIVVWRTRNGGFKRPADLRRVKGFGYKTFKRLEPFLDIKGDTTLK